MIDGIYDELLPRLFYGTKTNKKYSIRSITRFLNIYVNVIVTTLNINNPRVAIKNCFPWYQKKFQKGTNKDDT